MRCTDNLVEGQGAHASSVQAPDEHRAGSPDARSDVGQKEEHGPPEMSKLSVAQPSYVAANAVDGDTSSRSIRRLAAAWANALY